MLWFVNFVWWPLGKAEKKPGGQSSVYMLWRINSVWWRLGKSGKTQDGSLTFTCFDAWILSDGHCVKPKRARMSVSVYMFDASTSSQGDWAKPKKTHDVPLSINMFWRVYVVWRRPGQSRKNLWSLLDLCVIAFRSGLTMGTVKQQLWSWAAIRFETTLTTPIETRSWIFEQILIPNVLDEGANWKYSAELIDMWYQKHI